MEQLNLEVGALTDRQNELQGAIRSWATLQPYITTIDSEDEARWLMNAEKVGKNRIRILERLHSRYNKLRLERERRELSKGMLPF